MTTQITCITCGIVKPESDYYRYSSSGKLMKICKKCHQARVYNRKPTPANKCGVEHQNTFIQTLHSMGMYASPGKSSEYAYADVVVWGCVRIEVKYGEVRGQEHPNKWTFRFTRGQMNGGLVADLIAFMCPDDNGCTCYLFPPDYPDFYREGKLKPVLCFNAHNPRRNNKIQKETLATHRDNWHIIEQKRVEIAAAYQAKALAQ